MVADDRAAAEARERLWDQLGVPEEERDSDAARDLADDELLVDERRPLAASEPAATTGRSMPAVAAATGQGLYIIAGGKLHLLRAGHPGQLVGPAPAGARAMAATAAGALFVATDRGILLSDPGSSRFRPVAAATEPGELVAHPGGDFIAWSEPSRVILLEANGKRTVHATTPGGPVRAIAICDGQLIIFQRDGLARARPGEPLVALSGPLQAQRLICRSTGPAPWLAVGPSTLVSHDAGVRFRPRRDAPDAEVVDAAIDQYSQSPQQDGQEAPAGGWIWVLAADGGLITLPWTEQPRPPTAMTALPTRAAAWPSGWPDSRPAWLRLLPRVGILASHLERPGQREQRALAFAELPLGPQPASTVPAAHPRLLVASAAQEPPGPEQMSPAPAPDAGCLPQTRTEAARLAGADPARARSLMRRAGQSAWLPELRLRVERRLGRSESLDVKSAAAAEALGLDTDNDVRYEVRATWDLPRLVFHPEEVAAAHQALRMADMRREIESQVNRLYFERRRLMALGADAIDQVERGIRFEELTAELDALSGGGWSACLAGMPGETGRAGTAR